MRFFDGMLDGFMEQTARTTVSERAPVVPIPQVKNLLTGHMWLPEIQRFICCDWINIDLITAKAARRDDAEIPTGLWDKRFSLVFLSINIALGALRRLAMRWLRRHATKCLHCYLRLLQQRLAQIFAVDSKWRSKSGLAQAQC
jgi:hypothetical protein